MDGGVVGLVRLNPADRTRPRSLRRPACRKKALARSHPGGLRDRDRPARTHRAWNARACGAAAGVFQLLLWLWGKHCGRVPARARPRRSAGTGIVLGLEPWLCRRAIDPRALLRFGHLAADPSRAAHAVLPRNEAINARD